MILIRISTPVAGAALLSLVALAGCGSSDDGGADESAANGAGATVIATTSIWADITSEVACGAQVPTLIPPGADPHTFEPSLRDRELLDTADVVITNGLGLEEPLHDMLDTAAGDAEVAMVELTDSVDILGTGERDEHDSDEGDEHDHDEGDDADGHDEHDHDEGDDADGHDEHDAESHDEHDADEHDHDHADGDPHIWHDPLRVIATLDAIDGALTERGIETCTDDYRDDLLALDEELDETLADVPAESRVLVTNHESLAYFADRYGFEVVGTVIPSTSTLAETNAADLAALADVIVDQDVPAIFTERLESTADADALGDRLGVQVVPLTTDALGDDSGTDTYAGMMRSNASAITAALAP